jgi:hypothetical protein
MFKVWLDDIRQAPVGWISCRWPEEVIELIKTGEVEEISLDHDLCDPFVYEQGYMSSTKERTGYDVLVWLEEQVMNNGFVPPKIKIHTANPSAMKRMKIVAERIESFRKENR